MNKSLILFFIIAFALFSCKKQIYQFNSSMNKRLKVDEIKFDYFTAKSKIKFVDGEETFNAIANIRIKNDSIIWLSISPGIGIEILRAMITPDSIYLVNRMKKEFIIASLDSISRKLNFNLNYSMLQSIIIGNLILPRNAHEKVTQSGDYLLLKQQEGDISVDNYVNAASMKIEKLTITDDSTRNYMDVDYHNFQNIDSVLFAMDNSVSLFYSDKDKTINTQLIFIYTKASFSEKRVRFPFNVPNRYESRDN